MSANRSPHSLLPSCTHLVEATEWLLYQPRSEMPEIEAGTTIIADINRGNHACKVSYISLSIVPI
jgi:hypothetical protein